LKKINLFIVLVIIVFFYPGCSKDKTCTPKPVNSEIPQIEAYALANGIATTAHPSGLYYQVIEMGTGPKANANSKISITYTGKLMNGQTFDENTTPNVDAWPLTSLIAGWGIGIPLINEGGHIRLLIPSALGYGCDQYYTIPGNSVLYFDIHLVDVQ
jgi:FKBP-type peptidyl-prolyl cis-trans isomerase FkpA